MPIASTWFAGSGEGSITFSEPVEFDGPAVASAFRRGLGGTRRVGFGVFQPAPDRIAIQTNAAVSNPLAEGWWYFDGPGNLITSSSGLAVEGFGPIT